MQVSGMQSMHWATNRSIPQRISVWRADRLHVLTILEIERALRDRRHEPAAFLAHPSHAAVAMILGDGAGGLEVCFIRRAEREGDPWSGQVAFPGGRASPGDADAHAVAERETWEEVGLQLLPHHRLGPLPVRPIQPTSVRGSLTLSPFVYYVAGAGHGVATPRLPEEVASVFWVPIGHLFDADAVTELAYPSAVPPACSPASASTST